MMKRLQTWAFGMFLFLTWSACVSIDQKSQDALRIVNESGYLSKIGSALSCGGLEITVTQANDMSFRTMEVYFGNCAKIDTTLNLKFSPEIISANALYTLIRNTASLPLDSNDVISVTVGASGTLLSSSYTTERTFGRVSSDLNIMDDLSGLPLCDVVGSELQEGLSRIWNCEEDADPAPSIGAPYSAFIRNSGNTANTQVMLFDGSKNQVIALITDVESGKALRAYLLSPDYIDLSTLEALDLSEAFSI